jgi:predicted nucleotidyltransferase component of viral defense system
LLAGIFNNALLTTEWVFKGGTCLKKCYFETYRFSEDLDFTLKSTEHLDEQFLVATFREIAEWIYEQSGIEILRRTTRAMAGAEMRFQMKRHQVARDWSATVLAVVGGVIANPFIGAWRMGAPKTELASKVC